MAFKMKNPSVMKMAKEAGAAMKMKAPMKMKSPMKKDKDKHAGGVIGGKSRKGDVVTNQKDVAMRRINAMDITPEMKQRMIKDLKVESMGQRTTGKGK
jgi:hypothetical protein